MYTEKEIVELYLQGMNQVKISEQDGRSRPTIQGILKRHGVLRPNNKGILTENKEAIITLVKGGHTASEIAELIGSVDTSVYRFIKANKLADDYHYRELLKDKVDIVCQMRKDGKTIPEIAKTLGYSLSCVGQVLFSRKVYGKHKKVNSTFFDRLDNPDSAHVFGLWLGDGHIAKRGNAICLRMTDGDVIYKTAKAMGFEGKIGVYKPSGKGRKDYYCLDLADKQLKENLILKGCGRNKTKNLDFPDINLFGEHINSMVLGFFEADGCLSLSNRQYTLGFIGTYGFINGLFKFLYEKFNLNCHPTKHYGKSDFIYCLKISNRDHLFAILNWLYKDATFYMDRKYQKYQEFLKYYSQTTPC